MEKAATGRLNILFVGHIGAGKSSFINTVESVLRGHIASFSNTMSDNIPGVGTTVFKEVKSETDNVYYFDTPGYTNEKDDDKELGVQTEVLKALFEGRVPVSYEFNENEELQEPNEKTKPHCVIFFISAELLSNCPLDRKSVLPERHYALKKSIPHDVASMVVITKIDLVSGSSARDVRNIYRSKNVHGLVLKAKNMFGVEENAIFPVINFTKEDTIDKMKSVPVLYALRRAFDFASDRKKTE